ncbi:hypothetical protein CMV_001084 [Castanea mollissima]|uniref:CCHC-type domain-containing protein n=1 Tax=Castanea mollissima TaxID=60419 RepID=A0A8J4RYK4_9ROSI|nr:hypothetical protein CMV_001084 [Castanea mollissima]
MDCIDFGFDYYLVKFELVDDVDHILKGGPWFIGQHFLAIRQWELEFKASFATLSSVAVWIRLPELPIEFYENTALLKIGRAIGPVLRIYSHMANGERGYFTRLCIQVNLDKPLIRTIYLSKLAQCVQYEGINALCFSCGRIGHKVETCPHIIREASTKATKDRCTYSQEQGNEQGVGKDETELNRKEDYGGMDGVSRRKPSGKMRVKLQAVVQSHMGETSLEHSYLVRTRVVEQSNRDGKRKATNMQPVASVSEPSKTSTSNPNKLNMGKGAKGKSSSAKAKQKAISLVGNQPNGVGLSFKTGEAYIGLGKGFMSRDGDCQGPFVFSSPLGNIIYAEAEVNEAVTTPSKGNNNGGARSNRDRGGMDSARDNRVGDFGGQTGGMLDDGQCISGKNDPTCGANDQWNNPDKGNTRHIGDHQALHNSISGEVGVEDGSDGGMEIEGH